MSRSRVCAALAATILAALPAWRWRNSRRRPGRRATAAPGAGAGPLAGAGEAAAGRRVPHPPRKPRQARRRRAARRRPKPARSRCRPRPPPRCPPPAPAPANAVACGGVFAKDSTHLKLAIKYDFAQRHLRPGRRTGGQQDPGLHPVSERSQAPPRGAVGQRSRAAARVGDRDQRQVAMERAEGNKARPAARRAGEGERQAVQALRLRRRRHRARRRLGGRRAEHPAGRLQDGHAAAADPKAPQDARSAVTGDKEFSSSDASVRAVKPTVDRNPDRLLTADARRRRDRTACGLSAGFKRTR